MLQHSRSVHARSKNACRTIQMFWRTLQPKPKAHSDCHEWQRRIAVPEQQSCTRLLFRLASNWTFVLYRIKSALSDNVDKQCREETSPNPAHNGPTSCTGPHWALHEFLRTLLATWQHLQQQVCNTLASICHATHHVCDSTLSAIMMVDMTICCSVAMYGSIA